MSNADAVAPAVATHAERIRRVGFTVVENAIDAQRVDALREALARRRDRARRWRSTIELLRQPRAGRMVREAGDVRTDRAGAQR